MPMFYKSGGAWRTLKAPSPKYAGAWRTLKAAYYKTGGIWRKVFAAWTAVNESVYASVTIPGTATATITYLTDGTTTKTGGGATNWYGSTGAGTGTGKYVRATLVSGTTPTGTLGSWLEISTGATGRRRSRLKAPRSRW